MITATFRRLGPRGALIIGIATLALAIALVVALLGWAIATLQPPARPSPSGAILAIFHADPHSSSVIHSGVSARDGSVVWSMSSPPTIGYVASADGVYYTMDVDTAGAPTITAYRVSDGSRLWSILSPIPSQAQQPILIAHGLLIFTVLSVPDSPAGVIYALDVTTHTLAWHVNVPNAIVMDKTYPEVAVNATMLFVGTASSGYQSQFGVVALRLRDGSVAWSLPSVGLGSLAPWPSRWLSASPDAVYVADNSGTIVALGQSNGAVEWRSQATMPSFAGIQLTYSGATLYACATPNGGSERALLALDPATGDARWRGGTGSCHGQLAELNGVVYLAEQDLTARRASDGAVLWRVSPLSSGESFLSMQLDAGVVVAAASVTGSSSDVCSVGALLGSSPQCQNTGYLAAFDGATGALYWRKNVSVSPFLVSSDGWFTMNHPNLFP